jgi:hypothetical protein
MSSRPPIRRRGVQPTQAFGESFEAAVRQLAVQFLQSDRFKHAATKGSEREAPVRDLFAQHLPSRFTVTQGEVVDLRDEHSPQLDVMIYDSSENFAFYSGHSAILPAEALLASIEVKSLLTRKEIRKSIIAAKKLKDLKPFKRPVAAPRKDGEAADSRVRYFHCIVAYHTDLSAENWMGEEFKRYCEEAAILNSPHWIVDRIYVPNHGLLNPDSAVGLSEEKDSGDALLHFYMNTLNFLLRENARRQTTPYLSYAGRLTRNWKHLL